jgi:hypothetical protein
MSYQCCPDDDGGSHYHCPYCGCSCSMLGHLVGDPPRLECPSENDRPPWAVEYVTDEYVAPPDPAKPEELN